MPEGELPLVSVVTPSLNQRRYLVHTLRSVAGQDYPRVEHIVVDGGSSDGSVELLRASPGVRWISEPDRGQADAVNKGFAMARGAIFGWLNADDLYLPGAIAAAVEALRNSGAHLVHGGWRQIDEHGATIKDVPVRPFDYEELLERRNTIAQPATFFTREAFEAVGGLDPGLRYAMDYELWLKIAARFPVRTLERPLAAFRLHPQSKTVASYARFWAETHAASRRHGGRYFSRMYLDSLPQRRRSVARALALYRLLRARDRRGLAALVRRKLGSG